MIPTVSLVFGEEIINVAEVNQWIEERGQWLENIDRTNLALASGKLVLQKVELMEIKIVSLHQ